MSGDLPLSWFKVQYLLLHHPKFKHLTRVQKGDFFVSWLYAYGNQLQRGFIGDEDLLSLADEIGGEIHGRRYLAKQIMDHFEIVGLYDRIPNGWLIHDMDDWQPKSDHSRDRQRKRRMLLPVREPLQEPPQVPGTQPTQLPTSTSQSNQQLVAQCNTLEPVTPPVEKRREDIEVLRTSPKLPFCDPKSFDDWLCCDKSEITKAKKPRKVRVVDPRYIPLKAFIESEWDKHRSIRFATVVHRSDMVALAQLHDSLSLQVLQDSYLRFLQDTEPFVRKQSPIRYWASNLQRFAGTIPASIPTNGNGYRVCVEGPNAGCVPDTIRQPGFVAWHPSLFGYWRDAHGWRSPASDE